MCRPSCVCSLEEPGGLLRERTDVIKEEEEEEDAVPEGERSEGDGAEEQKADERRTKTEAEIAHETRRKRVSRGHVLMHCLLCLV